MRISISKFTTVPPLGTSPKSGWMIKSTSLRICQKSQAPNWILLHDFTKAAISTSCRTSRGIIMWSDLLKMKWLNSAKMDFGAAVVDDQNAAPLKKLNDLRINNHHPETGLELSSDHIKDWNGCQRINEYGVAISVISIREKESHMNIWAISEWQTQLTRKNNSVDS